MFDYLLDLWRRWFGRQRPRPVTPQSGEPLIDAIRTQFDGLPPSRRRVGRRGPELRLRLVKR